VEASDVEMPFDDSVIQPIGEDQPEPQAEGPFRVEICEIEARMGTGTFIDCALPLTD
jgi:hypothetical protein